MYVGPFVATWEKIVDIRSILRRELLCLGKKSQYCYQRQ